VKPYRYGSIFSVMFALACCTQPVKADVFTFTLKSGGKVEGEWLNQNELLQRAFVIKTNLGEVILPRDSVERRDRKPAAAIELETVRHEHPDTPDGQWALAEWCRANGLTEARRSVLARVVELDPEHIHARRALGYYKIDGKWQTQSEAQLARGYVLHNGKWMLPQEVEVQQQAEVGKRQQSEWARRVELWCDGFVSGRVEENKKNLSEIQDPLAVPALVRRLDREKHEPLRLQLVESLGNIGSNDALKALSERALRDANQEVRLTCVDHLAKKQRPDIVKMLLLGLKDKDNVIVNRAGVALRRMKDPSAILPLIDALRTQHEIVLAPGAPAGSTSATFQPGGGGFAVGGGGPQVARPIMANEDVLEALIALTGANFNFDIGAWKSWYAAQRRAGN